MAALVPFRLPEWLGSSVDPVDGNPFPSASPRHDRWREATRIANERIHRINAERLGALATTGPDWRVRCRTMDMIVLKFDVWAERYINIVWTDADLPAFAAWLAAYAASWLHAIESTGVFTAEVGGVELTARLAGRVEYWKAEAFRYRAAQDSADAAAAPPIYPGGAFKENGGRQRWSH